MQLLHKQFCLRKFSLSEENEDGVGEGNFAPPGIPGDAQF